MLDIILQILPVLGIILLVLLCIIIVFLLLVLFFPIRYKISGKKDAQALSLSAGANWLFGLLRVRYAYPEPGRLTVKLLWFMLYDLGTAEHGEKSTDKEKAKEKTKETKGKSKEKTKGKSKKKAKEKNKEKTKEKSKEKTKVISETRSEDHSDIVPQTTVGNPGNSENIEDTENIENTKSTENTDNTDNTGNTKKSNSPGSPHNEQSQEAPEYHEDEDNQNQGTNWIYEKIEKIKFTICSAYDKIKKIWENISYYVLMLQEEETHLLFTHVTKRLGGVFGNIRPRKLRINVLFGTGAPDTTGYAFGVYSMFSPMLGPDVIVTPDFEHAILEGDFDATGTITSVVLVWHFLRVVLDKKLWRFVDKLKKGREPASTFETETSEESTKQDSADKKQK